MASDWLESKDSAFQAQAEKLLAIIACHGEVWGLTPQEVSPLTQCKAEYDAAVVGQAAQATVYHAVVASKQARRAELERALRAIVRRINNHPGMTDELRQQMGLASPIRKPIDGGRAVETHGRDHSEHG